MGLFDNASVGYKHPLIPGCKVVQDESNPHAVIVTCSPTKVHEGKTYGMREGEEFKARLEKDEKGRVRSTTIMSDGGLPVATIKEMLDYLKGKI